MTDLVVEAPPPRNQPCAPALHQRPPHREINPKTLVVSERCVRCGTVLLRGLREDLELL